MSYILILFFSTFLSEVRAENFSVQFEAVDVSVFNENELLLEKREALLRSRFNFSKGSVEHLLSFFEQGKFIESKKFALKKIDSDNWVLILDQKSQPLIMNSNKEYQGFRYSVSYPDQTQLSRIFTRRPDKTMKIISRRINTEKRKILELVVYEGKLISEKEYMGRLKKD